MTTQHKIGQAFPEKLNQLSQGGGTFSKNVRTGCKKIRGQGCPFLRKGSATLGDSGSKKSQKFLKIICFLLIWTILTAVTAHVSDLYPFKNQKNAQRFHKMTHQLRCLVCQNQTLAASDAPLAKDLRQLIYKKIKNGETDAKIQSYLRARYGDFIEFNPPIKPTTFLLWFGPFLFLLIGLSVIIYMSYKKQKGS